MAHARLTEHIHADQVIITDQPLDMVWKRASVAVLVTIWQAASLAGAAASVASTARLYIVESIKMANNNATASEIMALPVVPPLEQLPKYWDVCSDATCAMALRLLGPDRRIQHLTVRAWSGPAALLRQLTRRAVHVTADFYSPVGQGVWDAIAAPSLTIACDYVILRQVHLAAEVDYVRTPCSLCVHPHTIVDTHSGHLVFPGATTVLVSSRGQAGTYATLRERYFLLLQGRVKRLSARQRATLRRSIMDDWDWKQVLALVAVLPSELHSVMEGLVARVVYARLN